MVNATEVELTSTSEPNIMYLVGTEIIEPSANKKILMLHGGGESSTSFQSQEGVVDLINALSDYDFIFAMHQITIYGYKINVRKKKILEFKLGK